MCVCVCVCLCACAHLVCIGVPHSPFDGGGGRFGSTTITTSIILCPFRCTQATQPHMLKATHIGMAHIIAPQVPSEEKLVEIRERYLEMNWHAKSYTFKSLVRGEEGKFEFKVREHWASGVHAVVSVCVGGR